MSNHTDIITDVDGNKIVVISDLRFKGRRNVDWEQVEKYLRTYIGDFIKIIESSDIVYVGKDFPDEFAHSQDTKGLRGRNRYAKANLSVAIKEVVSIGVNKRFTKNHKKKHSIKAKFGWYNYYSKFAIPAYDDQGEIIRYNVYSVRIVVRHDNKGQLYLYDIMNIKKEETSKPL